MSKKIQTLDDAIKAAGSRFSKVRADDGLAFAQEKMHVLSLIKRSRDLKKATPDSIFDAMLQAASMGLSLNPTVGHCYLIPRRMRKRRQGESDAEYEKVPFFAYASPSYRGLIHIAVSGHVIRFARAEVVFKDDKFIYKGPHHDIDYELRTSHDAQLEKNAVEVFAVAKTKDGDYLAEHMPRETVLKIRQMSEMPGGTMWHPDKLWTEGWKKAVLRRLYKTLPTVPQALASAMSVLDQHESINPASVDYQDAHKTEPPEALVVVNSEQVNTLHAMLVDSGRDPADADRQLLRLAKTFDAESIDMLPAVKFDQAKEKLKLGLGVG